MRHFLSETKFKNGAKALLINIPNTNVVNMVAAFNAGYMFAEPRLYELPHLLEHTVVGANAAYETMKDFEAAVEQNGAASNAFTSHYFLGYDMECAAFEFERILKLLCLEIATPAFKPIEIAAETGNVRAELTRNLTNYDRVAYEALMARSLGRRTATDGLRSLEKITRQDVLNYYQQTHVSKNLRLIFAGAITEQRAAIEHLGEMLEGMQPGQRLAIAQEKPQHVPQAVLNKADIPQLYYQFSQYAPPLPLKYEPALEVLGIILTERYKSWIMGEARDRGLAYYVASTSDIGLHYSSFSLMYNVTPDNAEELFQLIAEKLRLAAKGVFDQEEVEEAKRLLIGRRLRQYKTPGNFVQWYLYDYLVRDRVYDFHKALEAIKRIRVKDLTAATDKLFAKPKWGLSLVGNISPARARKLHQILSHIW